MDLLGLTEDPGKPWIKMYLHTVNTYPPVLMTTVCPEGLAWLLNCLGMVSGLSLKLGNGWCSSGGPGS